MIIPSVDVAVQRIRRDVDVVPGLSQPQAAPAAEAAALGIQGYRERSAPVSSDIGTITRKKALRDYSDAERLAWKRAKQRENAKRAAVARKWIAEVATKSNRRVPAICMCGRAIKGEMGRIYVTEDARVYHDRIQCRSWACPICAPKRAWSRALEIEQAILGAAQRGYKQLFLTFTIPHQAAQTTKTVLDNLRSAYRDMGHGYAYKQALKSFGFAGQIKSLDFTFGENGCHAHYHTIFFFDTSMSLEALAAECYAAVFRAWDAAVFKQVGRHISRRHGFDLEMIEIPSGDDEQAEKVALYTAKIVSIYAAAADKDKGSVTPFDLLDDPALKPVWQDYYLGSKGIRRLIFSRGLKDRLGVEPPAWEKPAQATLAHIVPEHTDVLRDESVRQRLEHLVSDHRAADALHYLSLVSGKAVFGNAALVEKIDAGQGFAEILAVYNPIGEYCCRDDLIPSPPSSRDDEPENLFADDLADIIGSGEVALG